MNVKTLGKTTLGLPIFGYEHTPKLDSSKTSSINAKIKSVLLIGGVHGDEPEGIVAARELIDLLATQANDFPFYTLVIPELNPEGMLNKSRSNSQGVDLNRNMSTKDWTSEVLNPRYNPGPSADSEPESKLLVQLLAGRTWDYIISLHSWKPMLNTNGDCGAVATKISELTGYTIEPTIGYPTPGCLGTYAGIERGIPTITYEIERGLSFDKIIQIHAPAIIKGLLELSKT